MCFKGKPRPHRAPSVKRSNHSFEQLFFLSSAIFSYHPLVPHQPDLLPVFISWPVYHKLKLICPLPRVEIVGNPTVESFQTVLTGPSFFFRHPLEHWKPVLCMNVSKWTSVRCLSFQQSWHGVHFTTWEGAGLRNPRMLSRIRINSVLFVRSRLSLEPLKNAGARKVKRTNVASMEKPWVDPV